MSRTASITTTTDIIDAMIGTRAVCPNAESSVGTCTVADSVGTCGVTDSVGTCDVTDSVGIGNCSSWLAMELSGGVRAASFAGAMNKTGTCIQFMHSHVLKIVK